MTSFEINGYKYIQDTNGVICQLDPEPFVYDDNYISCYDSEEYKKNDYLLQQLRLSLIEKHIPGIMARCLLDYGCGRGGFLKAAEIKFKYVAGFDVIEGNNGIWSLDFDYSVVTLFDVLEHIPSLKLKCKSPEYMVISVPNRPSVSKMSTWKHLKPNEHLYHFDKYSLTNYMRTIGYETIALDNIEDEIRKPDANTASENIITGIFKKL